MPRPEDGCKPFVNHKSRPSNALFQRFAADGTGAAAFKPSRVINLTGRGEAAKSEASWSLGSPS